MIGLLGYGLLNKSAEALEPGDAVPAAALPRLDGQGTGRSPTTAAAGCWSTSGPRGARPAARSRRPWSASTARTAAGASRSWGSTPTTSRTTRWASSAEYGITYPQLRDGSGDFSQDELGTTGVPESFLVGPDGRLVLHRLGPVTDDYLESNVVPYLTGEAKQ